MVNPRMRRLVGGLVAACGIVLSSLAVGLGGASAVPPGIPDQEDPPGDEAETTSTVRMRERCIWYVDGVPATINLLPTGDDVADEDSDGDPIGKVYDGSEYSLLVNLPELRAWNSGNESGGGEEFVEEHAFCTYFGATTGIAITGTWSVGGFTATASGGGRDDNLDFDMTTDNPLTMTIDKGTCRTPSRWPDSSAWQFGGGPFAEYGDLWTLTKNGVDSALGGRLMEQQQGVTTDRPANAPSGNDRCGVYLSVQVSIPEGGTPRYAGEAYTFSGPTFTTEIVIDSGGE
jgi:hypothetical protein